MIQQDQNRVPKCGGGRGRLLLWLAALFLLAAPASAQVPAGCPNSLHDTHGDDLIRHDMSASFCTLCAQGFVTIVVENPTRKADAVDFTGIIINEDLGSSGLTYVGPTTVSTVNTATTPSIDNFSIGGGSNQLLSWEMEADWTLGHQSGGGRSREQLILRFGVERTAPFDLEGLVDADRDLLAEVDVIPSCNLGDRYQNDSGDEELPIREPVPDISKGGRNVDAAQGGYSGNVFGHVNDDVIWRVRIRNDGDAPLQDVLFDDVMDSGNFVFDWVCDSEGDALNAARNTGSTGDCQSVGGVTDLSNENPRLRFDPGADPYIVANGGATRDYFLVGRVTNSCEDRSNTVSGAEWGCQDDGSPAGGIVATSTFNGSAGAGRDTDPLLTLTNDSNVNVGVVYSGVDTNDAMGSTGLVTITIRNLSNGTIKGEAGGMQLEHVLPPQYVIDPTFVPTVSMNPLYGNYVGMIDTIQWTNPVPGTDDQSSSDPDDYLANTDLDFLLTSTGPNLDNPDQLHMIRHGDVLTITFRTVLIDPNYYDLTANLDVRVEDAASTPAGTDPAQTIDMTSQTRLRFEELCNGTLYTPSQNDSHTANPEDLDVDMDGSELLFILTGQGDSLRLSVNVSNDGGHVADDYVAYITFGEAMRVQSADPDCTLLLSPPVLPNWELPADLPTSAAIYRCDGRGAIPRFSTETFIFDVIKNPDLVPFDDDLTFRADVIGEVRLSDGTLLWFPPPQPRVDLVTQGSVPDTDRANNYSLDGVRARVVGYDLLKSQDGICTENNDPLPGDPDDQVQIGEECSYYVQSGGWFGFQTPGFSYIAVQDIQVVDQIPDGQGYITSTPDPLTTSTSAIKGVSFNPPPAPLDEGFFNWTFNTDPLTERITVKDHWFRVYATTRLLNDPIDTVAPPNQHADLSTNILTSTFQAVFYNDLIKDEEVFDLGPLTIGYPAESYRQVDLTVTEPNLILTKEVCNETLYGPGESCGNFVPLADDGDAYDTYVYRIGITNEETSGKVLRAPAYDVTVTSVTDPSDQLEVELLGSDGVDNDADMDVDGADGDGEGTITDNVLLNGVPAQVIASYTHSADLLKIEPNETVYLYYRVDPHDDVAPLEVLTSSVTATFDSLEGQFGNQSAPQRDNGLVGGARQYTSAAAAATIQIIPVEVDPKRVIATSHSALVAAPAPQPVSVGEEVQFQLTTFLPVAQLRDFTIRDELPAGIRCVEAGEVDLDRPPYDAAGFMPGGLFTPTCTDTEAIWSFGDQTVTQGSGVMKRFEFAIDFIARVENIAGNRDTVLIENGGASTTTEVRYIDEGGAQVVIPIAAAVLEVREPLVAVTKGFSVAAADADDIVRVNVTATNNGSATAYNLRVLDDLAAAGMHYAGDIQGTTPPTADVATLGADVPLFRWAPGFSIAPTDSVSFSFAVRLDSLAQPLEEFLNTINVDWTSLPTVTTALNGTGSIGPDGSATGMRNGALPNAADALNDYEAEASAMLQVPGLSVTKLDLAPTAPAEIGTHRSFEVTVALPEGRTQDVAITDVLDSASVSYVFADNVDFDVSMNFVGISTINGQPPSQMAFAAIPADGTTGTLVWTVGEVVTQTEDDLAVQVIDPTIQITYFARVNNNLVTNAGSTLRNAIELNYTNGETTGTESKSDGTAAIIVIEPDLTSTKVLSNVTPAKAPADPPEFGDVLEYVVTVMNGGNATAYDVNVVDTLPVELTLYGAVAPTAEINAAPVAGFVATPAGAPVGALIWGRGNGDESLDIPAGGSLVLSYRVEVTTPTPVATLLENRVWVDWTSLDTTTVYERTGDGCPTVSAPDDYCFGPAVASGTTVPVANAPALLKQITQPSAQIGEAFSYTITVPETPYAFPVSDVRIFDELTTSGVDLRFIRVAKISGTGPWTPVNTGTATSLVIEDTAAGIDIPANEQIVLEITVVLEDTGANTSGTTFSNTGSYLYNWINDDPASQRVGDPGTSADMTIVGPDDMTLEKSGPASMTLGTPETFTLDVQNIGSGRAWNLSVRDILPDTASGGTCDAAPTSLTAQVFEADRTTAVSAPLVEGVDFAVTFSNAASPCEFSLAMLSVAAALDASQRLIISYQTTLDPGTQDGATLVNLAGTTEWFGSDGLDPDTVGDRRSYTRSVVDGSVPTLDHEDAHTVLGALPLYVFDKTVANLTTPASPATTAQPGDTLHYTLRVLNSGTTPIQNFSLYDVIDSMNGAARFVAGSMSNLVVPGGSDISNTDLSGGPHGTGVLDVRNLNLPNQGDELFVEFDIVLAPVIADGTVVTNQSEMRTAGVGFALSDDPGVNGTALPLVTGDEDPTSLTVVSAPAFQVQKVSSYLDGDPALLLAGERLRYTLTVKNIGSDNAVDALLRDDIPANTRYVVGSTTLNGTPVADDAPGDIAPFVSGLSIQAPEDPTPGAMRADTSPTANNVATLVFDVVVDPAVIDGAVIANQGFVSAVSGGIVDVPSDDPATALADDPTRDVVGNSPLLFSSKSVVLVGDAPPLGVVDPGDILEYTITTYNYGAIPASGATLQDGIPAGTHYVDDSLTRNGVGVGIPNGGVSPLIGGIDLSSDDLPAPLPGGGTINPGQSAVVTFRLEVDLLTAVGTLISNQAVVGSDQLSNLLTDGDGNPATGPEPTVVVVGDGQQLTISKRVSVVGGGAALPGAELEYEVIVLNVATVPATHVVVTDDLALPVGGQLSYVPGSATLNGVVAGISATPTFVTADYASVNGDLASGASAVLRFRATIDGGLAMGTVITNVGEVAWNSPVQNASATVDISLGGTPGVGIVSGTLWHDSDFDRGVGGGELALSGWTIELHRNDQLVQSVDADASGAYTMSGLSPNDVSGEAYELRFRAPDAGPASAALGFGASPFTNGPQQIRDILVGSGSNLFGLDLPIEPNGVVYSALQRTPVPGATLTLLGSGGAAVPTSCFDDPLQQGQITRGDGRYKFDLNFSGAGCPSGGDYVVQVTPPATGFAATVSAIIPPTTGPLDPPLVVPTCPGGVDDAVAATPQHCEVQASESAPALGLPARSAETNYHLRLTLDSSQQPGSSQIFNNHIPLDPELDTAVGIVKRTSKLNVNVGELIPYEIVLTNTLPVDLPALTIVDRYPAGFHYVEGSARIDGAPVEPTVAGRELSWSDLEVAALDRTTVVLLLAVGSGVSEGEFSNHAHAESGGVALSGVAAATVRVVPDPDFACTDVLGKVFDDVNRNGTQDEGEGGLAGVRLMTVRGLAATTDAHGRYHITCAVTPREGRGSNFMLKLDDRTLPSGYRMSTRSLQIKRATQGKALRFNFGASIHRVVSLDLSDAVFEPTSDVIRGQWEGRLDLLIEQLGESRSRLRLSYVADVEDESLVERRLARVERIVREAWKKESSQDLEIESEVFWRLGAPPEPEGELSGGPWQVLSSALADARRALNLNARTSAERHLSTDQSTMEWAQDPERLASEAGDKLEEREVWVDVPETVKLKNVVPPVRFDSGVAHIPSSTVDTLRVILDSMRHLDNVRLHLSGHSDDQPLSGRLAEEYGDNEGLSRERAGEVAEFIQAALSLPPESISYSWSGADDPVASNVTEAGRAMNRRVEVEVWHDELRKQASLRDVVIAEDIKRVKVCRMETVCKMRMLEGHARRARVKNLIAPLRYEGERLVVTPEFLRQVDEALQNLGNKQNVTVKFIGYTDNGALKQREDRIYGTHLAVSKARARLVSLKIKEALGLPSSAIASDGRGAARPVASNESALGRALNRRVEVEFWYDDPLQELPDEPMLCPDAADTELVARVYDPTWGSLAPLRFEGDAVEVPEGYAEDLRRAMEDVAGRLNVRLRFVGYTSNERLDRRTAIVYGDDIGLSAARARRTMEELQAELDLSDEQVEHEGRGYLYSNDVVNAGFIQNDLSQVLVQVVYDEPAVLDEYEGIAITPVRRELRPKSPLDLNLMRISVDGEPIDDPGRSSADIQRCTDVALEEADVEFRFDSMSAERRLSVTAEAGAVGVPGAASTVVGTPGADASGSGVGVGDAGVPTTARFKTYSNYPHFLERSEIRIFEQGESRRAEPLAIIEVGPDGTAEWQPPSEPFTAPTRELQFVLRAYDAEGRFDETAPQSLWVVKSAALLNELGVLGADGSGGSSAMTPVAEATETASPQFKGAEEAVPLAVTTRDVELLGKAPLLEGYGESGPLIKNIPLGSVGSVTVHGQSVPEGHRVWVAGSPVPVDENGEFISEAILPSGMHTVEVNVVDEAGKGELFLRDLELKKNDWFYMGIADVTFFGDMSGGKPAVLSGQNSQFDDDAIADGRLAFFVKGKFANGWKLTASADTGEGPIGDLFSNFLDKSHESLFRRIDPDYHYPTFGDEGTVEELAPTLGKFFVRLSKDQSHLLWGNFSVGYRGNELALVERGLYGGNIHYESPGMTSFGESRLVLDGFAADPGTVPSREDFRGTGGSLYYLRHRDLLNGSDRLRIELRDKDSGLVTAVVPLREGLDYDIDTLQGRVLLSEPIAATVADELLVRSDGLRGNEAWLVVQYEYTPGFEEIDTLSAGGRGHYWFGDFLKLGVTASRKDEDGAESSLYAADVTFRKSPQSWFKLQAGYSEGQVSTTYRSDDGGFDFIGDAGLGLEDADAFGYRVDASIGFEDFIPSLRGQMTLYAQILEAGYTAPGLTTLNDTQQFGGQVSFPVLDSVKVIAKADRLQEDDGLKTTTAEVDIDYQLTDQWSLSAGVRYDDREDDAPLVAATQEEGMRTDAVVEVGYDSQAAWSGYAFGQGTLASTGNREDNVRGGVGGEVRVSDRIVVSGEVSHGTLGPAAQIGTKFQKSDRTSLYLNYGLDTERGVNGVHARRGNLVGGAEMRFSDSASVFLESRFQHAKAETGLTRAVGMNYSPSEHWDISGNLELGKLSDRRTKAETERRAVSATVTYHSDEFLMSSGIEYRFDDSENPGGGSSDRTTWLFRNSLKYQMTPDWKLVAKFNHSFSDSSLGNFFDGDFTEAVVGYAYRPVKHDRLNALLKFTYFYNFPTAGQVSPSGASPSEFIQKSHIAALDLSYDVLANLSVGGKYAYRLGEVSLDRDDPEFFDNSAHLVVLRTDLRFLENWEALVEGRTLILPDLEEHKIGALLSLHRYFGKHFKAGVGYNFTDFSDDLTDLSYDHHGWFFNMTGAF